MTEKFTIICLLPIFPLAIASFIFSIGIFGFGFAAATATATYLY
jgi:hypothetical protein